ncbi:TPA: hypothetical protein JS231_004903 [Escherichia coli]|uniref:hypothetical protein n=1 Tax=Escherichia coli TaxID=562 RepID=UPI00288DB98A|nr:hypothetical protein [Escherichia coli]MED9167962.1 hypothetical protein [Escherichia coli]HAX9819984.1 hypothetical protein [Escherichia coli]HAX9989975.1 hypothetical protein [Escherichia coli]HCQ3809088.1 hypothetical protein [Escherichia coli]
MHEKKDVTRSFLCIFMFASSGIPGSQDWAGITDSLLWRNAVAAIPLAVSSGDGDAEMTMTTTITAIIGRSPF